MHRIAPLILIAALALTGCASTAEPPAETPTATVEPAPERADVPWDDYAADVKTRIDDAEAAGDCDTLQAEFEQADANNDLVAERTDHNNAVLMTYIDEALRLAGCYD